MNPPIDELGYDYTPTEEDLRAQEKEDETNRLAQLLDSRLSSFKQELAAEVGQRPAPAPEPQAPKKEIPASIPVTTDPESKYAAVSTDVIRDMVERTINEKILEPYGGAVNRLVVEQDLAAAKALAQAQKPELIEHLGDDRAAALIFDLMYSSSNPHVGVDNQKAANWALDRAAMYLPKPATGKTETGEQDLYTGATPYASHNTVGHQTGMRPPKGATKEAWMGAPDNAVQKVQFPDLTTYNGDIDAYQADLSKAEAEYVRRKNYAKEHGKEWTIEMVYKSSN